MTRPRMDVENSNARKKTLGSGLSLRERGASCPKYITVGCDILIVPRRKKVNQAVAADVSRARTEIIIAMVSDIRSNVLPTYYPTPS